MLQGEKYNTGVIVEKGIILILKYGKLCVDSILKFDSIKLLYSK